MLDREKVRNDLIHQAIISFSENSYKKTKLTDIGKKCGVSTTVIYSYYGSKEKLFNACVDYVLTKIRTNVLEPVFRQSNTLYEFIENFSHVPDALDDDWKIELNFYVMLASNNWNIASVQSFIRNFEQNLFNYMAAYLEHVTAADRYWLLMIDTVMHTWLFSTFNDFYRRKVQSYMSLYEVSDENRTEKFRENLLKDLYVWIDQLSSLKTLTNHD